MRYVFDISFANNLKTMIALMTIKNHLTFSCKNTAFIKIQIFRQFIAVHFSAHLMFFFSKMKLINCAKLVTGLTVD